ncbi:MAG: hypothetical protein NC350_04715 [Corallococcus sp.]|nr:hypothetical protein [Corallococcus sp.]
MNETITWLNVAKDEVETLITYLSMYKDLGVPEQDKVKAHLYEIMGDEFNHALIGLLSAAKELGIKIPTDELEELFDNAFGEESGDED